MLADAGPHALGFAVADVREVAAVSAITRLFRTPRELLGVAQLRGELLPIVDLRAILDGTASAQATPIDPRWLVLRIPSGDGRPARAASLGVAVERVRPVERLPESALAALPPGLSAATRAIATGIVVSEGRAHLIIDPTKLAALPQIAGLRVALT